MVLLYMIISVLKQGGVFTRRKRNPFSGLIGLIWMLATLLSVRMWTVSSHYHKVAVIERGDSALRPNLYIVAKLQLSEIRFRNYDLLLLLNDVDIAL